MGLQPTKCCCVEDLEAKFAGEGQAKVPSNLVNADRDVALYDPNLAESFGGLENTKSGTQGGAIHKVSESSFTLLEYPSPIKDRISCGADEKSIATTVETALLEESPELKTDPPPANSTFKIHIEKNPGDVVGLDVDWSDMDNLKITKIKPGLIAGWNALNPAKAAHPGDYIIDINGTSGNCKQLLDVVKSAYVLDMTIERRSYVTTIPD